jgi:acetate kinase
MTDQEILWVFNAGSSSLKFSGFRWQADARELIRLFDGAIEDIGRPDGRIRWTDTRASTSVQPFFSQDLAQAGRYAFHAIHERGWGPPDGIGHRFVTGGPSHLNHQRIDGALTAAIEAAIPYAPLHLPAALAVFRAAREHYPQTAQVACFDTTFHRTLPAVAARFPLPRAWFEAGVRKYGFHGLSYEYIVSQLDPRRSGRTIIAHLGNGSSLAAIRDGQSIETTMGMTPAGGVMMATRPGDLDPGALLYLLKEGGLTVDQVDHLCNHEAGLKGVSNLTGDMEQLLASTDPAAQEAVEMFAYAVRKAVGALSAVLEGLDTLVFTGGIGEHAAEVRQKILEPLAYLGIRIDPAANRLPPPSVISDPQSPVVVRVIPTDENRVIAQHTHRLLHGVSDGPGAQ